MFGFGKKKLDARTLAMMSIELAMFIQWIKDNRGRKLKREEAQDIARRILDREKIKYGQQDPVQIAKLAFASDATKVNEFRKQTQFDVTVEGFCQSIGIAKP